MQASVPLARHHPRRLHSLLCLPVGFLGGITVASVVGIGGLAHFTWHRQLLAVSGLVGRGLLAKITTFLLILGEASLPIYLMAQRSLSALQRSIFQDVMQGAGTQLGAADAEMKRPATSALAAAVSSPTCARPVCSMMSSTTPFCRDRPKLSSSLETPTVCLTAAQALHGQALLTVTNAAAGPLPVTDLPPREMLCVCTACRAALSLQGGNMSFKQPYTSACRPCSLSEPVLMTDLPAALLPAEQGVLPVRQATPTEKQQINTFLNARAAQIEEERRKRRQSAGVGGLPWRPAQRCSSTLYRGHPRVDRAQHDAYHGSAGAIMPPMHDPWPPLTASAVKLAHAMCCMLAPHR